MSEKLNSIDEAFNKFDKEMNGLAAAESARLKREEGKYKMNEKLNLDESIILGCCSICRNTTRTSMIDYGIVISGKNYCPDHADLANKLYGNIYDDNYWRMHYAGLAMQGMCSRHANCDHPDVIPRITLSAFKIADAMIEESKKVK